MMPYELTLADVQKIQLAAQAGSTAATGTAAGTQLGAAGGIFPMQGADFMTRLANMINMAEQMFNSFARLKDNPLIAKIIAEKLGNKFSGNTPQNFMSSQTTTSVPQWSGKQIFQMMLSGMDYIYKEFGDMPLSQLIKKMEENQVLITEYIEVQLKNVAKPNTENVDSVRAQGLGQNDSGKANT